MHLKKMTVSIKSMDAFTGMFTFLQIGCFLGFSVTASVIAGIMFICYCVATAGFADDLRYDEYYQTSYYNTYYSRVSRHRATVGAGLASCQLTFAIVEFFVSLASSIYCCNAVCCGVPAVGSVSDIHCSF